MIKKTVLAYVVVLICIVLLVVSYMQWKDKLSSVRQQPTTAVSEQPVDKDEETEEVDAAKEAQLEKERLLSLITNQDEQLQQLFSNRINADKPVNFLIVGSQSMTAGNPGYADRLTTALKANYGDAVQVTSAPLNMTSEEFLEEGIKTEIDLTNAYDVVLLEPFTLNNNGQVVIEDEHEHIEEFQEMLTSVVEDVVLVLQPPQPFHEATFYLTQVNALESFAESKNIPYINHWTSWPDSDSDEVLQFLNEDRSPNSEGADLWTNTLIKYFISK